MSNYQTIETTNTNSSTISPTPMSPLEYDDCPICLSKFNDSDAIYSTDCHHSFCGECITKHLTGSIECPLCRAPCKNIKLRKRAGQPLHTAESINHTTTAAASSTSSSAAPLPPIKRSSKDIVVVKVKYNKQTYDVPLTLDSRYSDFRTRCGQLFSLDSSHIKLIHKGKLLSKANQDLLTQVLQHDSNPTFQLVASQQLPQGKWQPEEEKRKCIVQ